MINNDSYLLLQGKCNIKYFRIIYRVHYEEPSIIENFITSPLLCIVQATLRRNNKQPWGCIYICFLSFYLKNS